MRKSTFLSIIATLLIFAAAVIIGVLIAAPDTPTPVSPTDFVTPTDITTPTDLTTSTDLVTNTDM